MAETMGYVVTEAGKVMWEENRECAEDDEIGVLYFGRTATVFPTRRQAQRAIERTKKVGVECWRRKLERALPKAAWPLIDVFEEAVEANVIAEHVCEGVSGPEPTAEDDRRKARLWMLLGEIMGPVPDKKRRPAYEKLEPLVLGVSGPEQGAAGGPTVAQVIRQACCDAAHARLNSVEIEDYWESVEKIVARSVAALRSAPPTRGQT